MKNILFLFMLFALFAAISCDDNNRTPESLCNNQEYHNQVVKSECLAEDLMRKFGCPNLTCFSRDPDIRNGNLRTCTFIDCETLSCDDLIVGFDDVQPGLITEISVDESDFVIGIFLVDELIGDFFCGLVLP